jgi:predicted DNA-binding transcriptional regulator YafY
VAATTIIGGLEESSLSAMNKLEHVLPARLRERLEDVSEATVSVPRMRTRIDPRTLAETSAATRARHRVRFSYVDGQGRASERHAEPLRLVVAGSHWYLVAFDLDRDDWRTFRLDRVSGAKATGMRSARRPSPDPVELVTRGIAVEVYAHRATVTLMVPSEEAVRHIARTVGSVEPIDSKTSRLVIGADELGWLARFLLNLPFEFVVEAPEELRDHLAAVGRKLVTAYG